MAKSSSASSRTANSRTRTMTRKKTPKMPKNNRKAAATRLVTNVHKQSDADGIDEYEQAAQAYPSPASTGQVRRRVLLVGKRSSEVYHADSEGISSTYPRRFSHLYGHGHPLDRSEKQASPTPAAKKSGTKRKATESPSGSSHKKVRFAKEAQKRTAARKDYAPSSPRVFGGAHSRINEPFRDIQSLNDNTFVHLLNQISEIPHKLYLSQITGLFLTVQNEVFEFAHDWFGPQSYIDANDIEADVWNFPIEDLVMHHPALYFTTMNVLDASTTDGIYDGWRKFFADPQYRQFLVTAILGEWFTQRIFKVSSFGMPPGVQQRIQEEVEEQYLWYEGFVRAKRRAEIVNEEFTAESMGRANEYLREAAAELASEIVTMLRPILDFSNGPFEDEEDTLKLRLIHQIERCAYLNWSIIRSGEDGTMIRCADRVENGKQFWPTAPMRCINESMVNETRDDSESGKDERLVVKMTCWGRIEALVPQGLDQVELAELQQKFTKDHIQQNIVAMKDRDLHVDGDSLNEAYDDFCWDCADITKVWNVLPKELQRTEQQRREKAEMLIRNHDLRLRLEKEAQREARKNEVRQGVDSHPSNSDSDHDYLTDSGEEMSDVGAETGTVRDKYDQPLRGAWLEYYKCLTPHRVYCEWAKPEAAYAEALEKSGHTDAKTQPMHRRNGLAAVVSAARADLPFLRKVAAEEEDILLKLWNIYADHNLKIEWSAFLLAIIYGLYRGGGLGICKQAGLIVPNLLLAVGRIVSKGAKYCGSIFFQDLKDACENLTTAALELKDHLIWLLSQIRDAPRAIPQRVSDALPSPSLSDLMKAMSSAQTNSQLCLKYILKHLHGSLDKMTGEAQTEAASVATAVSTIAASSVMPASVASQATGGFSPFRWWRGNDDPQIHNTLPSFQTQLSAGRAATASPGGMKFAITSMPTTTSKTLVSITPKVTSTRISREKPTASRKDVSQSSRITPSYKAKSISSKVKSSPASPNSSAGDKVKEAMKEQIKATQPIGNSANLNFECDKWPCTLNIKVNKKKRK